MAGRRIAGVQQRHHVLHAPQFVRDAGRHGGRDAQALVDADKVVEQKVERLGVVVVLQLFVNPFANRVKCRMHIRMVRFWRST